MTSPTHPRRPNVLWIFGDQHRSQALGYGGDPNLHTPVIDRMAAEGLTFTAARTVSPLCSPARGSLMTGRYPHHAVAGHQYPLPVGQRTVAHVLREAGYHTAYFGKWHRSICRWWYQPAISIASTARGVV